MKNEPFKGKVIVQIEGQADMEFDVNNLQITIDNHFEDIHGINSISKHLQFRSLTINGDFVENTNKE